MPANDWTPFVMIAMLVIAPACPSQAPTSRPAQAKLVLTVGDGQAGFKDGTTARFQKPIRMAPYGSDAILVADIGNHAIRIVRRDGRVSTLAGGPELVGHADGPTSKARFSSPHGVAVSAGGVIAVAEAENHTVRLLTPTEGTKPDGETGYRVSTLAGTPGKGGMVDGVAAEALFNSPHAVVWLGTDALLVADIGNARLRVIEKGRVRTVAGTGKHGTTDGEALRATFTYPMDLAAARDGSYLVADAGTHLIRRWRPGKDVSTLALQGKLATPHGICPGPGESLLIAELGKHVISAADKAGRLTRVYGTGEQGESPAQLNRPAAVLYHADLLWIADLDNHQIKAVQLSQTADGRESER